MSLIVPRVDRLSDGSEVPEREMGLWEKIGNKIFDVRVELWLLIEIPIKMIEQIVKKGRSK